MGNENECAETTSSLHDKVHQALQEVRPALQSDGGDIELVRVAEDGTVFVKMTGACSGCPMSQLTLSEGVERRLKGLVPEVRKVLSV
ncbi:MAG: NifU family protein [Planctomycetota bacterium]|jgi:Fe-S cluster biogenesis protein NfuA